MKIWNNVVMGNI